MRQTTTRVNMKRTVAAIAAVVMALPGATRALAGERIRVELGGRAGTTVHDCALDGNVDAAGTTRCVREAKSQRAEREGYTRRLFGEDNWKMLSDVRVKGVYRVAADGRETAVEPWR